MGFRLHHKITKFGGNYSNDGNYGPFYWNLNNDSSNSNSNNVTHLCFPWPTNRNGKMMEPYHLVKYMAVSVDHIGRVPVIYLSLQLSLQLSLCSLLQLSLNTPSTTKSDLSLARSYN